MNLLDELVRFYYSYDKFQKEYLSPEEAVKYHKTILEKGRVEWISDGINLLGYCESWRINFEQFGRIICGEPFFVEIEDIESGSIAYLANTTVHPDYRKEWVLKEISKKFFNSNTDALYFCGQAKRKKTQPVKVFKMQEAYKKWCGKEQMEEVI